MHLLLDELSSSELEQLQARNILLEKGVEKKGKIYCCQRCGNMEQHLFFTYYCARCQTYCTYCRKCITMGRVSECSQLVSWESPAYEQIVDPLRWEGILSESQQVAAETIVTSIQQRSSHTIWAVCGSGKTELLFPGIKYALENQLRVCIATPRTDVVLELFPRIQSAFSTEVIALYGGSEHRNKLAPLTIATTHQLIRYKNCFDVMIIDEVDAFPYSVDSMLQFAVKKSLTKTGMEIYLTATPNRTWQHEISQNKRPACLIPVRFHRKPLPLPTFQWCGNWHKAIARHKIPIHVEKFITTHLQNKKQAFFFVPHVNDLKKVVEILKQYDAMIEGVHAGDSLRKEKMIAFRAGNIPILVTTTILERGVTVPNIDVAVLGAEDEVFTESALVQIAGRVGRSAEFPTGEIYFFHYGKTVAMNQAKKQINMMNKLAEKRGLLQ